MTEEIDQTDPLANQGLVREIALKHLGRGLSLDDLIGEGQVGLLQARERWAKDRGLRFTTFAYRRIQGAIDRSVREQVPLVSVPLHVQERIAYPNSKAKASKAIIKAGKRMLRRHVNEGSLEISGTGASLGSLATGRRNGELAQRLAAMDLAVLMSGLQPVEAEVIRRLYGLDGHEEMLVSAIARHFGKSYQWVYNVEARAMEYLRQRAASSSRRVAG